MDIVRSDIVRYLVLIMPGFIGYRIYEAFTSSLESENEEGIGVIKVMSFGLPGYLLATVAISYEYGKYQLLFQFLIALMTALAAGLFSGWLEKNGKNPMLRVVRKINNASGISSTIPTKFSLDYLDKEYPLNSKEGEYIASIYKIDGGNEIIGCVDSWNEKEVVFKKSPKLSRADIDSALSSGNVLSYYKVVNYNSGYVIEIVAVKSKFIDDIYKTQLTNQTP